MNERIKQMARQSGATDQNGDMATTVFCFTEMELDNFAELIVKECAKISEECGINLNREDFRQGISRNIKQHFGVE